MVENVFLLSFPFLFVLVSLPFAMRVSSRGHATLHLAVSVGMSVRPSVRHIFEFRAVSALLLLPNRPRLDCRVSGLVFNFSLISLG